MIINVTKEMGGEKWSSKAGRRFTWQVMREKRHLHSQIVV